MAVLRKQGKEKTTNQLLKTQAIRPAFLMHTLRDYNGKSGEENMAEDKTFTQEEVNKLVGQARLEGKDAGRKEFEGWISPDEMAKQTAGLNEQLAGLNDKIKTLSDEKTNLQTQLTEKDGLIAKYETDSVKTKVAREFGLSYEATEFLKGDTEDAIRKSAESLKGMLKNSFTPPAYNPEPAPSSDPVASAWAAMSKDLFE